MPNKPARGNTPALPSRRQIIAAAPLAALTFSPAAAASEDPIIPHYRRWTAALAEWRRLAELSEDWEGPEFEAVTRIESEATDAMVDMTPQSPEGFAALAHVLWYWEGPSMSPDCPEYADACKTIGNRLIAAIWRGASGRDGLPR